jgi:hypothetical protein
MLPPPDVEVPVPVTLLPVVPVGPVAPVPDFVPVLVDVLKSAPPAPGSPGSVTLPPQAAIPRHEAIAKKNIEGFILNSLTPLHSLASGNACEVRCGRVR